MRSFHPTYLKNIRLHPATAWLLSQCGEAQVAHSMRASPPSPQILQRLQERSLVQSVESSNRIEGVEVAPRRLESLILGREVPQDRDEEDIAGYRDALEWIEGHYEKESFSPTLCMTLRRLCQSGSGDCGQWKQRANEIIEISPTGERSIRFVPVSPELTPQAMEQLCLGYKDVWTQGQLPPLIATATAVFDFLCIHPFRDGNGRVSRLLMYFLLLQNGFTIGRYTSLERLIEESKDDYYQVLKECSVGWHTGAHDLTPWWQYMLSTLKRAYSDFAVALGE